MLACALAIGGLDPGGGAGLAADLRSLHAAGVFGCAVATLITVQSTDGLVASHPLAPRLLVQQAAEVRRAQNVLAIKVGALGSLANVRAVAKWLQHIRRTHDVPVIVDPVMLPTRGASRLLAARAIATLRDELLPQATLVTANAPEAAALTGEEVRTVAHAKRAARRLVELGAQAALVKGGHLAGRDAVDLLAYGRRKVVELRSERLVLAPTHGGGCVLASLIAGYLASDLASNPAPTTGRAALGRQLETAIGFARATHQRALRDAVDVGGAMRVLVPRP